MTNDTLKITFGQRDKIDQNARERIKRAETGETGEAIEQEPKVILNFEDFAHIERLMSTSNLELLNVIISEQPASIRQAAEAVDRGYKEVYRNLEELEELGVIEFTRDGASKRPILLDGAKAIDFSFTMGDSEVVEDRAGASA